MDDEVLQEDEEFLEEDFKVANDDQEIQALDKLEKINSSLIDLKSLFQENMQQQAESKAEELLKQEEKAKAEEEARLEAEAELQAKHEEELEKEAFMQELAISEIDLLTSIDKNLNTLIGELELRNQEFEEDFNTMKTSMVEGFWFLTIVVVIALGIKVFFDNVTKW